MSDYLSRDQLIHGLCDNCAVRTVGNDNCRYDCPAFNFLASAPAVAPLAWPTWISVEENTPPEGTRMNCWCVYDIGTMRMTEDGRHEYAVEQIADFGSWDGKEFYISPASFKIRVTHWLPLPGVPKEGNK